MEKSQIKPSSALLAALVDNSKENTQKADKGQINSLYGFCKARHPDALLLFRYGSFFEIVEEDAIKAAKALAIAPRRLIRFSAAFLDLIVKDLMDAHHKIVILDLWPNQ